MPRVDSNAPLATNSDAAMWREDHDAAIRYIEALLAERETWAPVMEAAEARQRAWLSYQNAPGFSAERDRLRGEYMRAAERFDSAILKACAALAAPKEGNDEQNTTQA